MADHLEQGIAAFEAGEHGAAFLHFRTAIQTDPESAAAWYWLSRVVDSPEKQRDSLERALLIDPHYQPAVQAMAALEGAQAPADALTASPTKQQTMPAVEEEWQPDQPASSAADDLASKAPPPPVQDASIWPYPRERDRAVSLPPLTETTPPLEVEPSHEKRLEALAELEPLDLHGEKPAKKGRRRGLWLLGALFIMLLLAIGYALLTFFRLPSYESLAPLLATISPQALSRGFAGPTRPPATAAPAETLAATPDVPVFKSEQWLLEPVDYERNDLDGGQSQLIVDLALANYSRFLGAVTIDQRGTLVDGNGNEYAVDFGFEPRMLIMPGTRLHSVDEAHVLRLELEVPTESEDYELRIAYKASLLNLDNGLSSSGEGVFKFDAQQVVPGSPSMFVNGSWDAFLAESPSGVYAIEPGKAADFLTGQVILEGLSITPGSDPAEMEAFINASLWNTSSEVTLTLRTRYPTFLRLYRDSQWGTLVPANNSIQSMSAEPDQAVTEQVWSTNVGELPEMQDEIWCALGLFEITSGAERSNRGVVTCFPVAPVVLP